MGTQIMNSNPFALHAMHKGFTSNSLTLQEPTQVQDIKSGHFVTYDERYKAKFDAAENIQSETEKAEWSVLMLKKQLEYFKKSLPEHRSSLNQMSAKINEITDITSRIINVTIKGIRKKHKDQLLKQKDDNYRLVKSLNQEIRDKKGIQLQIELYQKRIAELEKLVGIQKVNSD